MSMRARHSIPALLVLASASCCAHAGSVVVNAGGTFTLEAGDLSATVFGGSEPAWSAASLEATHSTLRRAGIDTDGKVTIAAAQTSHGLALLVLVDEYVGTSSSMQFADLRMQSLASGAGLSHIADSNKGARLESGMDGVQAADVTYKWNANGAGEGFAWTQLGAGDSMDFRFSRPAASTGLDQTSTFQFVSWTGTTWELLRAPQNSFNSRHQFEFSAEVIQTVMVPTPTAAVLACAPLLVLGATRRRRSR